MSNDGEKIPIILLKTRSSPVDNYEDHFTTTENGAYSPIFSAVLEHSFRREALKEISDVYRTGDLGFQPTPQGTSPKYGGIIFTSQRAVEAFSQVINTLRIFGVTNALLPSDVPFYVVGPATARGLRTLDLNNDIVGEETGNGEALAKHILEHYNGLWKGQSTLPTKPALLFLVGEQRRDIVPKTLQDESLPAEDRIRVDELVVYETTEMKTFKSDFSEKYLKGLMDGCQHQWVVVFSPTGCKAMFEALGLLDAATGKYKSKPRRPFIATIGPTTRDYLKTEFDYDADVCARTPSPEGVGEAIAAFMAELGKPASEPTVADMKNARKRQRTE